MESVKQVQDKEVNSIEEIGEIKFLGIVKSLIFPNKTKCLLENLYKQIGSLYMSTNYSDVTFIVEDQKILAHRYILAARSEYFHSLLYGSFSEANQTEIKIKAPVDAFKILLGYIYTGQLSLSKILNIEVIIDVVELGNAYNFPELQGPCEKYLKKIISLDNVCLILDATKSLNFYELKKDCLYFIDKNSDNILADESFKNLSKDVLIEILKRDSFYTKEIKIFNSVNVWCMKNHHKIEVNIFAQNAKNSMIFKLDEFTHLNNIADIKLDIIHIVRLPLIPYNELVKVVWKSSSLSPEILLNVLDEQTSVKPFKFRGFLVKEENVASSEFNSRTIRGDMEHALLNGDKETYKTANGYTRHSIGDINDSAIIVELGCNCIINHIKLLLWDCDNRSFSYFIEVSIDQETWERVIDYSRFICRSWQHLYFKSTPVKFIKIVGTHCSVGNYFDVVSLEAFYIENFPEVKNSIVVPKTNVSLSTMGAIVLDRSGNILSNNIINGNFLDKNAFTQHVIDNCSNIIIRLSQPYYLGSMRLLFVDGTAYGFSIETSTNNKDWEKIVAQSRDPLQMWECFNFPLKPVIFIKLMGTSPLHYNFCVVHIECPSSIDN